MASTKYLFSEELTPLSKSEVAWCVQRLAYLDRLFREIDGTEEARDGLSEEDQPYFDHQPDSGGWGIGWQQTAAKQEKGPPVYGLALCHAEDGSPLQMALFVQEFISRFRPGQHFTATFAEVSNRPVKGGFSGGALLVTADDIQHFNARDWSPAPANKSSKCAN